MISTPSATDRLHRLLGRLGRRLALLAAALLPTGLGTLSGPQLALAHGEPVPPEPGPGALISGWSFEPEVAVGLGLAAIVYLVMVSRVNRGHPEHHVRRGRSLSFLAGLAVIAIALMSGIGRYDTTLFSVHMVQHILLTLVAPPLLLLAAPLTLLLRYARPEMRRGLILPALHSRVVRLMSFPLVAWLAFTAVMWGSHFSALFDAALEDAFLHQLEHLLYLSAGLLFWWPVVGLDPSPWRMSHPARILYVFLQMPQNTFLGLAILTASAPLYAHYVSSPRVWGPSPLADQQLAGGLMWILGDILFFVAIVGLVAAWMRAEERKGGRLGAGERAELAAIRAREASLADRRAAERGSSVDRPSSTQIR